MPAKLERCVKSVMSKQGVSESRAFAICTAAMDSLSDGIIYDAGIGFKATLDKTTGFLKAPVTLARVGVQYYRGYELGLADRALYKIGVFRPPEEVFHADALTSFENMVVTDDHPLEAVTIDNVKDLQMGQVSNIADGKLTGFVGGTATITNKDLIKKIQDGKVEVSVGYSHDLKKESGEFQGQDYEFVQTNIRGNHLAIVQAGRCGDACKLTIDDKGGNLMIITIDGIEYDVEDKQLAQAITKQQATHDAEKNAFAKKLEKEKEEKEDAVKEKDKAEAKKEAMSKDILSDAALSALVTERAKLIANVTSIMGDKAPDCDCPVKAMSAVVDHVFPDMDLEGKSNDYIAAAYDMALAKHKKAKKSMDGLSDDGVKIIKDKDGNEITRDSARNKYMSNMGLSVEV